MSSHIEENLSGLLNDLIKTILISNVDDFSNYFDLEINVFINSNLEKLNNIICLVSKLTLMDRTVLESEYTSYFLSDSHKKYIWNEEDFWHSIGLIGYMYGLRDKLLEEEEIKRYKISLDTKDKDFFYSEVKKLLDKILNQLVMNVLLIRVVFYKTRLTTQSNYENGLPLLVNLFKTINSLVPFTYTVDTSTNVNLKDIVRYWWDTLNDSSEENEDIELLSELKKFAFGMS